MKRIDLKPKSTVVLIFLCVFFSRFIMAQDLLINNAEDNCILIPEKATQTEAFAASELQKYIEKITKLRLPIKTDVQEIKGNFFSIGKTSYLKDDLIKNIKESENNINDSFIMKRKQNIIFLAGVTDRGTIYSVYTFLKKYLGVRWYSPGALGECIPARTNIRIGNIDDEEKPDFLMRGMLFSFNHRSKRESLELADWCVKNRLNYDILTYAYKFNPDIENFYKKRGGAIFFLKNGHNFHSYFFPITQYSQKHPEYYPLVKGKRTWSHAQLCLSNPEVIRIMAEKMIAGFDQDPDAIGFGFCKEDGTRHECECAACRKLDPPNPEIWRGKTFYVTDRYIKAANKIAEIVGKKYPDKFINFMAYTNSSKPPVTVKPSDKLIIQLYTGYGCPKYENWKKRIDGWTSLAKNVFICPCWENHINAPMNMTQTDNMKDIIRESMIYFKEKKIHSLLPFTVFSWGIEGCLYNIIPELMWKADSDINKIEDDYYKDYYSESGVWIRKFVDLREDIMYKPSSIIKYKAPYPFNFNPKPYYINYKPYLNKLDNYLDKALSQAPNETIRKRVKRVIEGWNVYKLYQDLMDTMRQWNNNQKDEAGYLATKDKWLRLYKFLKTYRKNDPYVYNLSYINYMCNRTASKVRKYNKRIKEKNVLWSKFNTLTMFPKWKFRIDPDNKGVKEKWFENKADSHWKDIYIGKFWNDQGFPTYTGYAWYKTSFDVPSRAKGKKIYLYFAGIDELGWIYINGKFVGERTGEPNKVWDQPYMLEITQHVNYDKDNELSVRVHNYSKAGGIYKPAYILIEK
jgi:hypothetical protein